MSTQISGPDKEGFAALFPPQYLSYYPTKPYVVGTQKNRLIEMILLSTHNIGLADKIRVLEQAKCSLSKTLTKIRLPINIMAINPL